VKVLPGGTSKSPDYSSKIEISLPSLNARADPLSAALSVFTRFLSLPPEGELVSRLRRAVLSAGGVSNPRNPGELLKTEAKALAAAAAADKGVELSPPALAKYALLLDREVFSGGAEGGKGGGGGDSEGAGDSGDSGGGQEGFGGRREGSSGGQDARDRQPEEEPRGEQYFRDRRRSAETKEEPDPFPGPEPGRIKALAGGVEEPLLALLNRLRGKNGRRWIVLPLTYTQGEKEYSLTLRMLLRESPAAPGEDHVAADIRGERRWIFTLRRAGPGEEFRGDLRVFPGFPEAERRRLETGLRDLFPGDMTVRNGPLSLVMEAETTALPSVNEEV
jgi:hypothetical protein